LKTLDEGYNFALNLVAIRGLHPIVGIPRLTNDKMPFGCGPRGETQIYYMGEGGGFPQV
jgi:hypothetical protein